jgi:hypothetical protein
MKLENIPMGEPLLRRLNSIIQTQYPLLTCNVEVRLAIPHQQMVEIVCRALEVDYETVMHAPSVGQPKTMIATARYIITKVLLEWYGVTPKEAASVLHLNLTSIYQQIKKTHFFLTHRDEMMTTAYNKVINALLYEN